MDSLDAQCLLIELVERELPPPDLWHHKRSGELSCAYSEGEQTFTWKADAVAEMAERWRASESREVPGRLHPFIDAHRRLDQILTEAGRPPADEVVHDFKRRELRLRWVDEKLVLVVDEVPAGRQSVS